MIRYFPYSELGQADFGWLQARYHFSFSGYHHPERMGFGKLRVINDDRVAAGKGFAPHPHRDMEIITYVRSGAISHEDSVGNKGRTAAGDVQVMSAGSGVTHSGWNHENEPTTLYQIWIEPREKGVQPRWDARAFPKAPVKNALPLLVSGHQTDAEKGALYIHADAAIYGGKLEAGSKLSHPLRQNAYLLISEGEVKVNGHPFTKGDGAEVTDATEIHFEALTPAEILVIEVS
jgi:redox-sensitive bicupin YhaK (pirin superfamily)